MSTSTMQLLFILVLSGTAFSYMHHHLRYLELGSSICPLVEVF